MKKLVLALAVLGSVIGTSLTVLAYEDRRDHDWNDEYWHHHHYGYWHGERGYWRHYDHKHEFIPVARIWVAFEPDWQTKASLSTYNTQPRFGAT